MTLFRFAKLESGVVVHFFTAVFALSALTVSTHWRDLWKDTATAFATVGFFVTVYGVIFTIIEVFRTKAAAQQAADAAQAAEKRVESLYDARDSVECLTLLENALDRLHEDGTLSPSSLGRIVKLYAAEFSAAYSEETSPPRVRMGMVTSFAFAHTNGVRGKFNNSDKLKGALIGMMADLSAANDKRIHKDQCL